MVITVIEAITALAVSSGGGGSQTPWTSDIDGGQFNLTNVNQVFAQAYGFNYPNFHQAGVFNNIGNSFVSAANTNLPTGDTARSVAFWIKSTQAGTTFILHSYGTNATNEGSVFYVNGTGHPSYFISSGKFVSATGTVVTDGNYHHVVMSYSGSGVVTFYVDSAASGTLNLGSAINTILNGTQDVGFTPFFGSAHLMGNGAMLQVFNIALSGTQVSDLYAGGKGAFTLPPSISSANLVTQYTFDGNVLDSSGSGNNGTPNNITYTNFGAVQNGTYTQTAPLISYDYINGHITGIPASVSAADSTLTITPTTGLVLAKINLAHANAWTASQSVTDGSHHVALADGTYAINSFGECNFTDTSSDSLTILDGTNILLINASEPFVAITANAGDGSVFQVGNGSYSVYIDAAFTNLTGLHVDSNDELAYGELATSVSPTTGYSAGGFFSGNGGGATLSVGNSSTFYGSAFGQDGTTTAILNAYYNFTPTAVVAYDSNSNVALLCDGTNALNLTGPIMVNGSTGDTTTVTTSSLVGKTMTFTNGILTGFA